MLKFAQVDSEGTVEYAWSTKTYNEVEVIGTIETNDDITSEYIDLIEQMKTQITDELTAYIDSKIGSTT